MGLFSLKEDLTNEFREERDMLVEQIGILNPLVNSLKKPAAERWLGNTSLVLFEYLCYGLAIGCLIFMFQVGGIYPFTVLNTLYHLSPLPAKLNASDLNMLVLAGYGMVVLVMFLLIVIGRLTYGIRARNTLLHEAGKDIKIILDQHIKRKNVVDTIQQRHVFFAKDEIKKEPTKINVNEALNPGYEGNMHDGEEEDEEADQEHEN